jgi:L-fuconolactonase
VPDFPIVDAHVHLYDPAAIPIPWLAGTPMLNRRHGLDEYREQTRCVTVGAIVYVQVEVAPAFGLVEAHWVAERAREDSRIKAIVGWAPVEAGEQLRSYLERLVAVGPLIKGVRRLIQTEEDPSFCLQPGFVRGVQLLGEHGLSFDLGIRAHQLEAAAELARRCPQTMFMLDHLAFPPIAAGELQPWADHLAALAELPNVYAKISGVATSADHQRWTSDDLAPYIAHALAVFGEDRVAFGSDWPVVLRAASYCRWAETLDALTAQLSPAASARLWAGNAASFYRFSPGQ